MKRSIRALVAFLTIALAPLPALAQPSKENAEAAQKLFDEALVMMKAGKFADACPRLAESQKLDPGMGTKFRLAECYESAGLVGSAYQLFADVAADAGKAGRADRETQARARVSALQTRVPWMTLSVPPEVAALPGLGVKRDGEAVVKGDWGRKVPVDPGAHTITVTATGKRAWQESVRALEGGSVDVRVPPLEDEARVAVAPAPSPALPPVVAPAPAPAVEEAPNPGSGQRAAAIATGAIGVGGLVLGAVLGVMAKARWSRALSGCEAGDHTKCSDAGIRDGNSASTFALISTTGFIAGGAGLATGVVLWLTAPSKKAPKAALHVVPVIGPDGVFVTGRF